MEKPRQMYLVGTGAALNIPLGYNPDWARLVNLTDGTILNEYFRGRIMPFTVGTVALVPGAKIKGATSGAVARVMDVVIATGTLAASTAAGWIILDDADAAGVPYADKVGTFSTENITLFGASTTIGAITVDVTMPQIKIDTAVAPITASNAITYYAGDKNNAKGLTLAAGIMTAGKLFCLQTFMFDHIPYAVSV
jgi:hypothetical protein